MIRYIYDTVSHNNSRTNKKLRDTILTIIIIIIRDLSETHSIVRQLSYHSFISKYPEKATLEK
jgi:hypothetical protein